MNDMHPNWRIYTIEGERLTYRQIRERVPATVKDCTLDARLRIYQRRTWAALCEPPSHRPRPEQRDGSKFDKRVPGEGRFQVISHDPWDRARWNDHSTSEAAELRAALGLDSYTGKFSDI